VKIVAIRRVLQLKFHQNAFAARTLPRIPLGECPDSYSA